MMGIELSLINEQLVLYLEYNQIPAKRIHVDTEFSLT